MKTSFSAVVGVIDCTHLPDRNKVTLEDSHKEFTFLNLQVVSDSKMRISRITLWWPGSTNNPRIFDRCCVRTLIEGQLATPTGCQTTAPKTSVEQY